MPKMFERACLISLLTTTFVTASVGCGTSRRERLPSDGSTRPDTAVRGSDAGGSDAGTRPSGTDEISFELDDGTEVLSREGLTITICQTPGSTGAWQVSGSDPVYDLRVSILNYEGPGTYRGSSTGSLIVELGSYATGEFNYADNSVNGCDVTVDASEASASVVCTRLLWADSSLAGQLTGTLRCSGD